MKSSYCIRSSLSWPADLFYATRNVRLRLCNPPSDRCKKYQKINIIHIISMVFYGFFLWFKKFSMVFYGSIKFNQVEFPSFFRDPTSTGSGSQKISWSSCAQTASKQKTTHGRRQKKTGRVYQVWQIFGFCSTYSSTSNVLWILTWCRWFLANIQYMDIFFKTRNERRWCVSLLATVYWILVATTPFYLQVRGFQSNIDRGEPFLWKHLCLLLLFFVPFVNLCG